MANLGAVREMLDQFGAVVIERAQSNLRIERRVRGKKARRYASGNLLRSLKFGYWKKGRNIVQWFGPNKEDIRNYADVIEEGRRPNSTPPPQGKIYDWLKIKRIKLRNASGQFITGTEDDYRHAARRIAIAIGKNGIEGIHYMKEAIEDTEPEFKERFEAALLTEFETQLRLKADKYIK